MQLRWPGLFQLASEIDIRNLTHGLQPGISVFLTHGLQPDVSIFFSSTGSNPASQFFSRTDYNPASQFFSRTGYNPASLNFSHARATTRRLNFSLKSFLSSRPDHISGLGLHLGLHVSSIRTLCSVNNNVELIIESYLLRLTSSNVYKLDIILTNQSLSTSSLLFPLVNHYLRARYINLKQSQFINLIQILLHKPYM